MTGHTQITQNNKFAISFQNIKKEVSDEVDFVHAEKRESFLQINTIILIGMVKNSQSSPNNNFPMFLQDLKKKKKKKKKKLGMGLIFWLDIKTSKFLQIGIIVFDGSGQTCPNHPK